MRIGELAARTDVSAKTIRYYESIGLMKDPPRTEAGYRNYDDSSAERLRFIRDAQATGLTLGEITSVLELKESGKRSCAHTTELLDRHLGEIDAQIKRLEAARVALQRLADRATSLDPASCTDPNRCQVIDANSL